VLGTCLPLVSLHVEGSRFPFNKPLAQASLSPSISSHPFLLRSSWFKGTLLLRGKGWEGMEGHILACAKGLLNGNPTARVIAVRVGVRVSV